MARIHKSAAQLFAALGDETRLWLIGRLSNEGPASISRLTEGSNMTRQAIAKHLRAMEKARLTRARRCGRERLWSLEPRRLDDARHHLDGIAKQWEDALDRLRRFVET